MSRAFPPHDPLPHGLSFRPRPDANPATNAAPGATGGTLGIAATALTAALLAGMASVPAHAEDSIPSLGRASAASRDDGSKDNQADSPIPPEIRSMLNEAMAGGDTAEIATIVKYAVKTNPHAAQAIQTLVETYKAQKEEARRETIQDATIFALWDGKLELGGYSNTGASSATGISSSLAITRKGLRWTHVLTGAVDYKRANGATSTEHMLASYAPRYTLDSHNFVYGLVQYERDPVVGFDDRYSGSVGIGYSFIESGGLHLAATLGPSLRHTIYTANAYGSETKLGARSSLDLKWKLNPAFSVAQTTSAYGERDIASITSLTALDARVISKLTARLSYNLQYETDTKLSDRVFNTTSKITFIYDF